jgi:hypothetical protein
MAKKTKVIPAFNIKANKITVITPADFKLKDYLMLPSTLN